MKRLLSAAFRYMKKADMFLLTLCIICAIFGMILIYSATGSWAQLSVQIGALILGLIFFVLFSIIDVSVIASRWKVLFVFNVVLLIILAIFGTGLPGGYRIWLRFLGIGIQPSEIVKITFIIMLAYHIQYLKEYKNLNSFFSLAQLALHFSYLLILIPDTGNSLIFIFIFIAMLFMAGVKLRWFVLGGGLVAAAMPIIWNFVFHQYQRYRILAPFDPTIDPGNTWVNFQMHRSRIAIGSGQITGQGLGQGMQTQSRSVPEQWTDVLFSVVAEELGFIGAIVVLILIAAIILRCFYVASKARDTLSGLVCVGIGSFVMFQSLFNIGMTLGLLPVVGIAPPFFAYGGSSLATTFVAMGLVCGVKMRSESIWRRPL